MPNANHRSAFLLVIELANRQEIAVESDEKILEIGNVFAKKSKPLISEKEFLPILAEEKSAHHEAAREAIEQILKSVQS